MFLVKNPRIIMKKLHLIPLFIFYISFLNAAPSSTTHFIKVDQFGYLPTSKKVAVISDPQVGYNSAESFTPGTGTNQYQVRRWDNDAIVYSGTISAWNGGQTHTQSGDRGWYFDFTSVSASGSYYIFDVSNNVGSYRFEINDNVYEEVLKQAIRTFFYQRINFAKQSPYTNTKWADGACFEGVGQDRSATSRFAKGNTATAKDLHGGWMDAGDKNKYTTFATSAVIQLIEAYRMNPTVFKDNYNIPESGNGIPDVLDEVKFELDFLKRMQDATGTNGFFLKVGTDNYNEINPPSADTRPRYYLPECTSATVSGAAMFAVAGATLKNVSTLSAYGLDLINRAELAWARAKVTTTNFTAFELNCDDGDIKAGDADADAQEQLDRAFVAAVYLYESTGKAEYKTFAESNYANINPYKINWWGPYWIPQQLALLRLTAIPGVSSVVANNIRNQKASMNYLFSINDYNAGTDLYRSHVADGQYHWGHNLVHTNAGSQNLDFVTFNLNGSNHSLYKEVAAQYLHWMHGVNPIGMVMLSNMSAYGAEKSANEIYHTWFTDGSIWDNALTSPNGPAPAYVPGGPNKNYTGTAANIANQPPQKAYKDWNSVSEISWEITEPAIYSQAGYIMLLARIMPETVVVPDTIKPSVPLNLIITNTTANSISLSWSAATDNIAVTGYELYQNNILINSAISSTTYTVPNLSCNTSYTFYVKAKDAAGNVSGASNTAPGTTTACISLVTKVIYDESLNPEWATVSTTATLNLNNSNIVQTGIRSIRVDYGANGILGFSKNTAATTSSSTQLRFWVYNNGNNSIRVYTQSQDGSGNSTMVTTRPARRRWVEVIVSMAQLGNPTQIKRVIIQNSSTTSTTMYFDNIRLTNIAETQRLVLVIPPQNVYSHQVPYSDFEIQLYPNPATERTTLEIISYSQSNIKSEILDLNGKIVRRYHFNLKSGKNQFPLDLQGMPAGNYIISISDGLHTKGLKMLVN